MRINFGKKKPEQKIQSLRDRVRSRMGRSDREASDGLAYGMYRIMRRIPSYRVEHFFVSNFMSSQFFALNDLIDEEIKAENEASTRSSDKKK